MPKKRTGNGCWVCLLPAEIRAVVEPEFLPRQMRLSYDQIVQVLRAQGYPDATTGKLQYHKTKCASRAGR